jgi:hypothetical protein
MSELKEIMEMLKSIQDLMNKNQSVNTEKLTDIKNANTELQLKLDLLAASSGSPANKVPIEKKTKPRRSKKSDDSDSASIADSNAGSLDNSETDRLSTIDDSDCDSVSNLSAGNSSLMSGSFVNISSASSARSNNLEMQTVDEEIIPKKKKRKSRKVIEDPDELVKESGVIIKKDESNAEKVKDDAEDNEAKNETEEEKTKKSAKPKTAKSSEKSAKSSEKSAKSSEKSAKSSEKIKTTFQNPKKTRKVTGELDVLSFFKTMCSKNMNYFDDLLGGAKDKIDKEHVEDDPEDEKATRTKIMKYYKYIRQHQDASKGERLYQMKEDYNHSIRKSQLKINKEEDE